jgi:hypothetical protein
MATEDFKQDDPLKKALGEWHVTTPLPPRFQERVWQRIESAGRMPSTWDGVRAWLDIAFAKPAFAISYVAVLAVVGLSVGFKQAEAKASHMESQLSAQYVQSVDPYQKPRN